MSDIKFPRVVVPFTFLTANADNDGLKDFSPAVLPASAPDEDEATVADGGETGDGADPKVAPSSAPASAPTSPPISDKGANPASEADPANAEKASLTKDKTPTE
jgi:hypothetical protein